MPNAPRQIRPIITSLAPPVPCTDGGPVVGFGRFWYPRPQFWPAALSVVAHAAAVTAIVWTVGNVLDHPTTSGQAVFFIPPPQSPAPAATRGGASNTIPMASFTYFSGPGVGDGGTGQADKTVRHMGQSTGTDLKTAGQTTDSDTTTAGDNVYTSYEVDNVVQVSLGSAVPEYPPDLLARGVEGTVTVRFVVDTSGAADVGSIDVVNSSDPQFAASVRAALPRMRFSPAKLNGQRVRQLVEQPFRFNVSAPPTQPNPTDSVVRQSP
jgi:TonB family protein